VTTPSRKPPSPKSATAAEGTAPSTAATSDAASGTTDRTSGAPDANSAVDGEATVSGEFAQLSYEQARDALIDVVRRLESGAETLEESLALWERGEALARHCEQWLAGAQARLAAARPPTES
jgi:exodeoxyribonuclease VII small subunit